MVWTESSRAVNWCFTLNNYTNDDEMFLSNFCQDYCSYLIYGKEVGKEGTPHLQGYFVCKQRMRLLQLKKLLKRWHLEVAKHPQKAREYCMKEGNVIEHGVWVERKKSTKIFEDFKHRMDNGEIKTFNDCMDVCPAVAARYPRFVEKALQRKYEIKPLPKEHTLYDWQEKLFEDLKGQVDDRKIIFIVDLKGDTGKSWFCDYCESNLENVQILTPGKKADLAFEFKPGTKILFMDAPRSKQNDFIQYDFLEDIKNGRIFSPKYESRMKYFERPHVVVFMNHRPDYEKLSEDRYDVRVVTNEVATNRR